MANATQFPYNSREWCRWLESRVATVERSINPTATRIANEIAATLVYAGRAVAATPDTLVLRDGSGRSQIVAPAVAADIVNKGYVDGLVTRNDSKTQASLPSSYTSLITETSGPSDTSNWPLATAIVTTHALGTGGSRTYQMMVKKTFGEMWIRAATDASTWGPWAKGGLVDTGWVPLPLHANVLVYSAGTDPVYKLVGSTVTIAGAVKPANSTAAGLLDGTTGLTICALPAAIVPTGVPYSAYSVCQGSNEDRWLLSFDGTNLMGSRYGPGTPGTASWMPFSITYNI